MKRVVSIALIILMSLQSLYRVGLITYFEANRGYIAEFLCINKSEPLSHCKGHCFLKKNLEKAESQENVPSGGGREKNNIPDFLPEVFVVEIAAKFQIVKGHSFYQRIFSEPVKEDILRPPTV